MSFYTNSAFKDDIKSHISAAREYSEELSKVSAIRRGRIESDLRIALVVKCANIFENWFDEIMGAFGDSLKCRFFRCYFKDKFTNAGKNVSPEKINAVFNSLGVKQIKRDEIRDRYDGFKTFYDIRNGICHEKTDYQASLEDLLKYTEDGLEFMEYAIKRLDDSLKDV